MPVLLRQSGDLPGASAFDIWFAVTGVRKGAIGLLDEEKKLPALAQALEQAFNGICRAWWDTGRALSAGPGAELAYAPTCAGYGSDFGLMMAWGRLVEEAGRKPVRCLVLCDDPWLFRHLTVLPGVEAGKAPALWPATARLRLRGFLARLRLVVKLSWAALATRRQRHAHETGDHILLVYDHPKSTALGFDAYFGPMMTKIPALKRALHTDCPAAETSRLAADGRTASLHAWGNPLHVPGLLFTRWRPPRDHLTGSCGWLVRRAAETESGTAAHAMNAWQRYCQDAWLAAVRPKAVAWPWENHGWERAFCREARRLGVATIGYQHTVIGPHQMNYGVAANIDGEASLPETIVCDGPAYRDQLADWGAPTERLRNGGSLRIQRIEGVAYDAKAPVFVALSAKRGIARQQIRAIEAAAGEGIQFLVKEHPMYPLDVGETDAIRRTDGAIGDQTSLSAVVYSTGTPGLEALLAGLPTFRFLPEDQIAIDVLPEFVTARTVTALDLARALKAAEKPEGLNWEDVLSPVDWNLWRGLLAGSPAASEETASPSTQREKIA